MGLPSAHSRVCLHSGQDQRGGLGAEQALGQAQPCRERRYQRGWGNDVAGVPCPCQAALPWAGWELDIWCTWMCRAAGKGALLPLGKQHCWSITHGAMCCTKILEMTEELRVRCFWNADGLDLTGALRRCSGERVGCECCWGASPG